MRLFTRTRINKVRDGAKKKKVTKKKKFRAASSRCLLACIGLRPLVGDGVAKRDTPTARGSTTTILLASMAAVPFY